MAKVGFLGAGNMGAGMIARLLQAGHCVSVYNRSVEKVHALTVLGATCASTARETCENADAVMAMVGDDTASRAVWTGDQGALAASLADGAYIIECSTLSHDWVLELSAMVSDARLCYIDCPVTGLPSAAAAGELTLFLGGRENDIKAAQPFLEPLSVDQIHFGAVGAGTAYKLIVNTMGSIQILAAAEGLLLAEKANLDLEQVSAALGSGGAGSPTVARLCQQMVAGQHDKEVLFNAYWRLKDTRYGVRFAKKMGLESVISQSAEAEFQKVVDEGFSDLAESKVIDLLRNKM